MYSIDRNMFTTNFKSEFSISPTVVNVPQDQMIFNILFRISIYILVQTKNFPSCRCLWRYRFFLKCPTERYEIRKFDCIFRYLPTSLWPTDFTASFCCPFACVNLFFVFLGALFAVWNWELNARRFCRWWNYRLVSVLAFVIVATPCLMLFLHFF